MVLNGVIIRKNLFLIIKYQNYLNNKCYYLINNEDSII